MPFHRAPTHAPPLVPLLATLLATLAAGVALGTPRAAHAQACCGSAQVAEPGRLSSDQVHSAGLVLNYTEYTGRFAGGEHRELGGTMREFRQTLFASARVFGDGQLALSLPVVQTQKAFGGLDDFGGGVGDLRLSARWEFIPIGLYMRLPGISASLDVKAPTGRSPFESTDRARTVLQSDVTGTGTWDIGAGLSLDGSRGAWFYGLAGAVAHPLPATAPSGVTVQHPTRFTAAAHLGYTAQARLTYDELLYLSLVASTDWTASLLATTDPNLNAERLTSVGLQVGGFLTERFFVALGLSGDVPLDGFGHELFTGLTTGLTLKRVSYDWF